MNTKNKKDSDYNNIILRFCRNEQIWPFVTSSQKNSLDSNLPLHKVLCHHTTHSKKKKKMRYDQMKIEVPLHP